MFKINLKQSKQQEYDQEERRNSGRALNINEPQIQSRLRIDFSSSRRRHDSSVFCPPLPVDQLDK